MRGKKAASIQIFIKNIINFQDEFLLWDGMEIERGGRRDSKYGVLLSSERDKRRRTKKKKSKIEIKGNFDTVPVEQNK